MIADYVLTIFFVLRMYVIIMSKVISCIYHKRVEQEGKLYITRVTNNGQV